MKHIFICLSIIAHVYIAVPGPARRAPLSAESQVIEEIKAIQKAEVLYSVTKGRGRFTDLTTLANAQLIEATLASGEKHGYLFEASPVGPNATMFDLTARPMRAANSGVHQNSFYTNETLILYQVKGDELLPTARMIGCPRMALR